jgi:hypothetical protein
MVGGSPKAMILHPPLQEVPVIILSTSEAEVGFWDQFTLRRVSITATTFAARDAEAEGVTVKQSRPRRRELTYILDG